MQEMENKNQIITNKSKLMFKFKQDRQFANDSQLIEGASETDVHVS